MLLRSAIVCALLAPLFAADSGLTVHEWGTFTTVAAADGSSVQWVSLSPPADLPCFVYHLSAICVKCGPARVRMETPVVYFYTSKPLTASVHVDLPQGLITEWYPQAVQKASLGQGYTYQRDGNIDWPAVQVSPGATDSFPNAGDRSHYYAARETDSAPLAVGDQAEKVLFYRGIADFDIPISAKFLPDGKLQVHASSPENIGFAIFFENRGGKSGYRLIPDLRDKALVDALELSGDAGEVQVELAAALTGAGLYPKEAAAMIETWRDSWFEEGSRLFYLVPRKLVDKVLPIRISPAQSTIERVFVGRVELLSPWMEQTLETALTSGDTKTLARYGRFAQPFCDRIIAGSGKLRVSRAASDFLAKAAQPPNQPADARCNPTPSVLPTGQQ